MTPPTRKSNALEYFAPHAFLRCKATNLPAFVSQQELDAFFKDIPAITITHKWKCAVCKYYHHLGACRGPSGDSSGEDRRKIERLAQNAETYKDYVKKGLVFTWIV